jgi:hypothetical protein
MNRTIVRFFVLVALFLLVLPFRGLADDAAGTNATAATTPPAATDTNAASANTNAAPASASADASAASAAPVGINGALSAAYDLPADGEVSLGLYDNNGQLLRTITKSEFRHAGHVVDSWNGLDQWGDPVPAGSYVLKGIYHDHISTDYVMSFGNPGKPPWPTPDGKGDWLSDEAPPQGAATDGKWVFLAAPGSEKGHAIMAVDENGQKQWGTQLSFNPCTVSLAVDGDYLYALFSGPEITGQPHVYIHGGTNAVGRAILMCLDKKTGRAAQFSLKEPRLKVATWPYVDNIVGLWDLRNKKAFTPDVYTGQPRYACNDLGEATSAIGLAAADGFLYISLHDEDKIIVLKEDTGMKVDEIPVTKPAGLYAMPDHSLLAVSDKKVVQIDPSSKQVMDMITSGLVAPRCVTADTQGRFIYVSDWADSFQVKIFNHSGTLLKAVGKPGGRPWLGKWDPSGMILPTGIAVTDAGKLWVAEDDSAPCRISVWNAKTGEFLKEYLGPNTYGGGTPVFDPKDPTIVYAIGLRLKLDYQAKTWTPLATIDRRMDEAQPFYRNGNIYNIGGHILYHGDHEYMAFFNEHRITVSERKGDLFTPVAALGGLEKGGLTRNGTDLSIWDSDLGKRFIENYYPPFFAGHAGDNYSWTDTNNDGLVQDGEMVWNKAVGRGDPLAGRQVQATSAWGFGIGADFSIYWSGFCRDATVIYRLDPKGWTSDGAPIYDVNDSKPIVTTGAGSPVPDSLFATKDGHLLVSYGYENTHLRNTAEYFDRDGKPIWALPEVKEQGAEDIQFNSVAGELNAPGIGPIFGGWAWHGNYFTYLFNSDGLYVSPLLTIGRMGPDAGWDESMKTYYQDPSGTPYIINGANDNAHMLKINGLKGGRFQGTLTLTQADVDRATAARAVPVPQPPPKPIIKLAWNQDAPKVDGDLSDWNMDAGVALQGDKGRTAKIAIARDDTNLYLAAQVSKDTPFSNKGDNWQTLFISGDCVDLMISTNPKGDPHRKSSLPGDERLLLSEYQGKPVAVLYRPVVPGTKEPVQLMAANLDEITRLDSAKVNVQASGNSYTMEASVPLKDLGIDPQETGVLRGDLGLVFSDETGAGRAQRLYHYNKETKITADLTTEATLQPGEWGPIQFPLGKNLIKNGGFEDALSSSSDTGWFAKMEKNGAKATITDASSHSGQHSLLLAQVDPVVFSNDAFNSMDFRSFAAGANGGAGGGAVEVEQSMPVQAGHSYSFRINYRTEDLRDERQAPGPDRGLSRFAIFFNWTGDDGKGLGYIAALDERRNTFDWKQLTNWIVNNWSVNKPYLAPPGATHAVVTLHLETLAPNDLPKIYIDDLELVEASAEAQTTGVATQ